MSAHTPGPWTLRSARLSGDVGIAAGDYDGPIAEVFEELRRGVLRPDVAKANARLIAAAPALLAALQHLMRYDFGNSEGAKEARAAIEKATGEKLPALPESR